MFNTLLTHFGRYTGLVLLATTAGIRKLKPIKLKVSGTQELV